MIMIVPCLVHCNVTSRGRWMPEVQGWALAIPGRLELPTYGLGNRRSIRLSYGTDEPHRAMRARKSHSRATARSQIQ
jgi:hypothetical protein